MSKNKKSKAQEIETETPNANVDENLPSPDMAEFLVWKEKREIAKTARKLAGVEKRAEHWMAKIEAKTGKKPDAIEFHDDVIAIKYLNLSVNDGINIYASLSRYNRHQVAVQENGSETVFSY